MAKTKNILTEAELSAFCQQINMIIKAGFPIYYGIFLLKEDATDDATRNLLTQIYEPMEKGTCFYDAIASTGAFPHYMLKMVRVGEETGRLEEVLTSLCAYYQREADIRACIKQAVTYPLIMSELMLAVIVVLITKVVPIFANVYAELGSSLSGTAKTLMDISTFLNRYLLVFIVFCLLVLLIVFIILKSPYGKRLYQGKGLSLALARSRFANCMYLALSSGLDTDQGFDLAEDLSDNQILKARILECRKLMKSGKGFSESILEAGLFSKTYSSMITIGYKTSAMDSVMLNISEAYEKETSNKLQNFIAILEPTLIIILSFFIGLILISFLIPLLGIMSSIG